MGETYNELETNRNRSSTCSYYDYERSLFQQRNFHGNSGTDASRYGSCNGYAATVG